MNALNNVGLNKIYLCTWYKTFLFWLFICYWYYLVTFKAFIRIYQWAMSFYLAQWEYKKHFSQKKSCPMNSLWPKLQNEMKTWISLDKSIRTLFQNIPSYVFSNYLSTFSSNSLPRYFCGLCGRFVMIIYLYSIWFLQVFLGDCARFFGGRAEESAAVCDGQRSCSSRWPV